MNTQETNEQITKEEVSQKNSQNNEVDTKDKDAYILILRPSEEKIDFTGLDYETKNKIKPDIFFQNRVDKEDKTYLEEIIFKFKKKAKKKEKEKESTKSTKYAITFSKGDHTYDITFSLKDECFVYLPELKTGNKYLDNILKEPIKQNIVPLYIKLNIFIEALLKKNELEIKEKKLYDDTINLYEDKKQFSLLITLFLKIYQNNKDLCSKLLEIFYKINEEENTDREKDLKKELKSFRDIYSNAKDIIEERGYDKIHFYGVLFCYLHYYDKTNFPKMIEEFSEGNSDILYEILIQYYSHFMNPLKQSQKFYNGFIAYALKKDKELKIFKRVLNYIEDIESFLFAINSNIGKIFQAYEKFKTDPIKMNASLKLVKYKVENCKKVGKEENKSNEISDDESEISNQDDTKGLEDAEKIENECGTIIKLIEEIIKFSHKEKILAIYLKSTFWINLIKEYNIPDWENINNIFKLRMLYRKYNNLVNTLYEKEPKTHQKKKEDGNSIQTDINTYFKRDEFAFMLNKLIKEFFEANKNRITNSEILGTIEKYNPYFSVKDKDDKETYKNNREVYIFDNVNFKQVTETFISSFRQLNFEEMFEENITDYINKITSKIEDIQTFGNIIKLINESKIKEEKQKDYFRILEDKYKLIVKNDIKSIKDNNELTKAIKIIAEFVSKVFLFYQDNRFLEKEINALDDKIKSLIYIELIVSYNEEKYKDQKNKIYEIYLDKMDTKEGREDIINLVKKLNGNDRKYFIYEKLLEKCQFTKEDFFSNQENDEIQTLCLLNKELIEESQKEDAKKEEQKDEENNKGKEEKKLNILEQRQLGNKYAESLETILDSIIKDLDNGIIVKKDLEKFLNIKRKSEQNAGAAVTKEEEEEKKGEEKKKDKPIKDGTEDPYVKDKLELITLIIANYNPATKYAEYKASIEKINKKVENLKFIKDSLMIFHRNLHHKDIKTITNILNEIENSPIQKFKAEETRKTIENLEKHIPLCDEIKKVKDFLLFKKIFENAQGKDQAEIFEVARNKLKILFNLFAKNSTNIEVIFNEKEFASTFRDIKEELGRKNEIKSKEFLSQMIDYFQIKDIKVKSDLKMIINSKKYEMIVKSIKYFFDNFKEKKLILPKSINLSEMDLTTLKRTLDNLKERDIYNHEANSPYYRVFTSFYEKKEALDFLIRNIESDIKDLSNKLKDKLDPTNRSISIKDIDDTIECIKQFKNLINLNAEDIIKNIKLYDEKIIKTFESFSKKFGSIIELENKNEKNPFKEVYDIIEDGSLLFNLDNEDFGYKDKDGNFIPIRDIHELVKIKNKINIQPQKKIKEKVTKNDETAQISEINDEKEEIKDIFQKKCDKLLFFKEIITNLEIIYDKINILRKKGFNIPIVINVSIKYPEIKYKLNGQEKEFSKIKDYLFKVKNDYEEQLKTIYENEKYLRLLYGKLFRKVKKHQGGNFEISEMIRYILNKTSNKDKIQDGDLYNESLGEDYEDQYNDYTKKIFIQISKYLISLFKKNDLNFQKHYDNMKIIEKSKYRGISIKKCEKNSMEEYILGLFLEKLDKLPIAQNILICSNETSIEEIQSFLYRAILCESNTLFVVEILESFSNFQHNKMYSYIDKLLSIKLDKYKKQNKEKKNKDIDKSKSREYLDSYIVFVYKKLDNENAFKNELEKYTRKHLKNREAERDIGPNIFIPRCSKEITLDQETEKKLDNANLSKISNISEQDDDASKSKIYISNNFDITKNIKVISSDVCGLGKSFRIKKMISKEKRVYYHLPLGGKLTKNSIYQKIFDLFKKIKEKAKPQNQPNIKQKEDNDEEYSEFNNVAIHLDLIETKEISLVNEFLFSFLITKFYANNENIIYIPNNIKIYIEVPNSFENYLTKFGILNAFNIENIVLGEQVQNETSSITNITNVSMLPLELDKNIREKFKTLNGFENDKDIENFIKDNFNSLEIKEYSYHQVQTFIKLYLSQFNMFNSKLAFTNTQDKNITRECIENFAKSTKYFTNGGFAKLIMQKKYIKDIFELCLDAYENDLSKAKFDTPLIFIDKEKLTFKFEKLPDISEEESQSSKKDVDIAYLIDGTGSMKSEIKAANENVIKIFDELTKKYKNYNFRFGAIFYRDKVDCKNDKDEFFQFTTDMKDLEKNIGKIKAKGGGDIPEDWVGGYEIALKNMEWRNGIKLIIHIADAGAHGKEFSKEDKYPDEGPKLTSLIEECAKRNINIIGFKIGEEPEQSFEKLSEIYDIYKLHNKNLGQFIEIYDFIRENEKAVSENFNKFVLQAADQTINPSYKYLKRLKKILYLPNDIEKKIDDKKSLLSILEEGSTDNYVITEDNYKKMILLIYRIRADVPVIIMGETGCGKTSLIKKLSQILNNGEELVETINIHPGITDEEIINKMKEMNAKAKSKEFKNKELWVFFDEINTCLTLSLLTEIFINRTFNGEELEKNIRLIGACNPYRKRKELIERCGLTREDDEDDQLVYKVEQLPQSLLYYVFSFGSLRDEDEKKYIRSIIQILFTKEEEKLRDLTTEAISKCHIFLRKSFGNDPSIVSLREIARFKTCVEFFIDYFIKKVYFTYENDQNKRSKDNEPKNGYKLDEETKKLFKIKSIICSIYLCYFIRLTNEDKRGKFDAELVEILLEISNVYCEKKNNDVKKEDDSLFSKIKYQRLAQDLRDKNFQKFSELLKIEEEFLLDQIELDKGIGKNQLLKENLFLLFLSVVTKIPLIIVGKPGTGKSLSAQLIYNSMRGIYSKPKDGKKSFFLNYPKINQTYFQGSESTTPDDVEELFKKTEDSYNIYKKNKKSGDLVPIYMILFDELGLAEKSHSNPLKVLHSKLEYGGKTEGICFIGISNYSLDAAKINRALNLSVPNLEDKLDQLKHTAKSIIESISDDIYKDNLIFNILARAYSEYKYYLNFIKKLTALKIYAKDKDLYGKIFKEIEAEPEYIKILKRDRKIKSEFHGNRDFYNIIKGVAIEGSRLNSISDEKQIVPIINAFIERNFGGISYNIDIDFNLIFDDIKEDMEKLKEKILNEKLSALTEQNIRGRDEDDDDNKKEKENNIKVTSVYLFKKIYNEACPQEKQKDNENLTGKIYQIGNDDINKYDQNKCINDNINDNNSRYLLLEIKSNIAPLINQIIRAQNPDRKDKIDTIIGSPFSDDNNSDYKSKKVSEIQNCASQENKLIILQNLDPIQPYLYDLYNMNYKIIDEQKFVRICLENFSEQLTPVNEGFKIIVLVDKKFVNKVDMAFLNRLEKMQISFKDLLDKKQKDFIKSIQEEIRLKEEIKEERNKFNYDLGSLLINCSEQDIGGLIYYLFLETKKENINDYYIKDKIYTKISNLLPEDIAVILSEKNPIKKKYYEKKKYYNFKQYMKALYVNDKDLTNYKISVIYTYSNIVNTIEGYNHDEFMISAINTEGKLKIQLDDIKNKNKLENNNRYILIKFEDFNSDKLQFTSDYIINYCKDEYHYILIIYLHRYMNSDDKQQQRIYSIPNIYDNINQLFIDNLEAPEITLRELLSKNIKDIMFSANTFKNLDKEFRETLSNFVYDKMGEKTKIETNRNSRMSNLSIFLSNRYGDNNNVSNAKEDNYSEDIIKYMMYIDSDFKNKIIEKAKELIEGDNSTQDDCLSLINKMLREKYVNKDKIDIISCILDYIKENVFEKYLRLIFEELEDNNFLSTLLEINEDRTCRLDINDKGARPNNSKIIKELETKFLKEIKVDNNKIYEPKFLSNYKIPGFYNFYKNISDYLTKNISTEYVKIEKNLRDIDLNEDQNIAKEIEDFHEKEEDLLKKVIETIEKDKLYKDLVYKITPDLILKDYITFYLEKYLGIYSKPFYQIISKLLGLRFSDERNIIKTNIGNKFNIVIIKIMWIEANTNYIEGILKAFEFGKDIINDHEGSLFYQIIFDSINDPTNPIKYIASKERAEHLREVNECFYLFLSGLCISITTNDMDKIESIGSYCGILEEIYKIIKNIDDELYTYLNELYIIDELIKVINYNPNTRKIIIEEIRNKLTENAMIIQKNQPNKNTKLIENFKGMNDLLLQIKNEKTKDKYYNTLKYIYKKEIQKINDKVYCSAILEEIIKEKEIIKISNDIFQILLESSIDLEKFSHLKKGLLNSTDNIIKLLNKKLSDDSRDYYLALSEAMIYFFERNSLIYLKDFSDVETFVEEKKGGHLVVFKECNEFLSKNNNEGLTYITELFCIGYIKSFCYTFIKMHNKKKFNPENIIKIINESDKMKMVKLYIYKIIYNKNNRQINVFLNSEIIKKYKLDTYQGFNEFINKEEIEKLEQFTYDNIKSKIFNKLKEYEENKFEEKIEKDNISLKKKDFDDFFMASYKLILSKLNNEDFENDISYTNFFSNVCEPLYRKDDDEKNKLIILMRFLYEKDTYKDIKREYKINSEDIDALLYGYRYCLNEVKDKEENYIYSYLYNRSNLSDFDQKFYPGNDNNKEQPYYDLYNKIINHFKEKPDEGCFVCLCDKGYYHSVPSGFPDFKEINMKCPECQSEIGAKEFYIKETDEKDEKKIILIKKYETTQNNNNYYRIFKDNEQIKDLKRMKENYSKFEKLKYMTIEEFKEQYIRPLYNKEKGLNTIDINNFKKENKIIRNLSQISYRLLNYILYCHLFFAKLFTQSERFDNYLPKGMAWITMIKECFTRLKIELENKGIKHLDIFMNCVFKDLFDKLHNQTCINKFEELIKFEDELEKLIQEKCEKAKEEIDCFKKLERESIKDEKSAIALIKEIYDKSKYKNKCFPYYEFFYFTDYLDEDYIYNILKGKDENNYPVLSKYLKFKKSKKSKDKTAVEDKYSLDNLNLFNKTLKLFNDKYSNKIARDLAERQTINKSEIYNEEKNAKLIDDFIKLYNGFKILDDEEKELKLNKEKNVIIDFLLIEDNKYGKSYKAIYKEFAERQNNELEDLLQIKINSGEFNINCKNKINIQQIKENEIFSLTKKFKFTKVIFNSSYRKYIDTKKHENYNEYVISLKQIESEMTNSLLKNKKLLNVDLIEFNFNNEVFSYEITNLITKFEFEKMPINIDDKEVIYNFIKDNAGNNEKYKIIINNFITLIEYLNKESKAQNSKINANTKICDIEIVKNLKNISKDFKEIFLDKQQENQEQKDNQDKIDLNVKASVNLNVSKITNLFNYFLNLIFKYVKKDIEKYQEKNKDEKSAYNLDDKNMAIKKGDLASAIRMFITLVLFREKDNDKGTKVKSNKKNIIDYLRNKDLWKSSLYNNSSKFEEDLSKIKGLNIKIKEILFFYYYLVGRKDEGFEDEVIMHQQKREEEIKKQKEREEQLAQEQNENQKAENSDDDKDEEESSDDDDDSKKKKKKKGKKGKKSNSDDSSDSNDSDDSDDNRKKKKKRKSSD